jgi:hypothetical protein
MRTLRAILVAILVVVSTYCGISWLFAWQISASSQATWAAMNAAPFECPPGMEPRTEGWGEAGYSRVCSSLKEGKWEAWENGRRQLTGSYHNGKPSGVWTSYNQDGSPFKVTEYRDGVEVSSSPAH